LQKFVSWDRKNIQSIWEVPTLRELTLAGVKPNSFHSGEAFKSLTKLRVLNTSLKDISFIENGVNIHFLELLNFSKIEDLTPLKQLKNLRHLRIDCNKVVDFSFLRDLTNLETLYISSKMGAFEFDYFLGLTLLKKVNILSDFVTVNENIDYSNFHIGDEVAELFYKSYKNSSDDEGESIEDWKSILNDFMNGNYGVIIKDLCELLYIQGNIASGIVAALDEGELYIVTLAVLPEYRGKNLSLNLLSRLSMKAQEKGYEKIVLYVTDSNIPAINIYNKAGFEVQKGT